ncbi:MAG: hypoxanthine-guanine phosphoribosyltransferase [Gammaproteobacteria bacterium CG11_big_fil_rev_8_21_14_0_20_46_22]|nr:MAG: hypoxanthine-guanine phosphoribosyltransferase [Gammaproteobacteria bacterium CG12_big_fil_rev_8_21_14_0_65_46_12]PIR11901.1 MAG: hypoxanthine-guanine phosphoribosyltransferase [Gammaproteobacteria bacterium CG11_big_fil_rev_8_21_14_0_20_46_22]
MVDLTDVHNIKARGVCLHTREEVEAAIQRVADDMAQVLSDQAPLFLTVMNGAVVFAGQLATRIKFDAQFDYIHATRYRGEIEGRDLQWIAKPRASIKDRVVVIIEDILDTGLTLAACVKYCEEEGAKKVYTAALIDKDHPRSEGGIQKTDFTGLHVEDKFLYGYGLDYQEFLRNEPGIYAVET